ncbi:MAG: hypothetical protein KME45_03425 [Stenomitos rutilans HA7619-LM2]|jgi:hypothetical protein|nr:hypothetical protein [Stenomitos rutilans HA7619-LM2]MBW4469436.1 hypothetical protein [Stenomitos rutilans HA7619-LM2]
MPFGQPCVLRYQTGAIAVIYPVPRSRLTLMQLLLNELVQAWVELGQMTELLAEDPKGWGLVEAIAAIIPAENALPLQVEALKTDINLLERLFFGQVVAEVLEPSLLVALHTFTPQPKAERVKSPDDPITVDDLPFPSSGDYDYDTIANLANGFGWEMGLWLYEHFPIEGLDKFLYTHSELQKDPEQRVMESLKRSYDGWKQENAEEYERRTYQVKWWDKTERQKLIQQHAIAQELEPDAVD